MISECFNDSLVHAEMNAFKKLLYYLSKHDIPINRYTKRKAELYIYRINPVTSEIFNSQPCFHCCKTLNKYRHLFKKIVWSIRDTHFVYTDSELINTYITKGNKYR